MATQTAVSSPRTQRKRPADLTGKLAEDLAAQKTEQQQEAASRMAMVAAEAEAAREVPIDFETGEPLPEVEVRSVEVNSPTRSMRVNTDIENMTWGRKVVDPGDVTVGRPAIMGPLNNYTFEEGVLYRNVPVALVEHLEKLGYLSYIGA